MFHSFGQYSLQLLIISNVQIPTRLPAPELDAQKGQPVLMGFLSQVMATTDHQPSLSSFAECIIMATIYGRCLSHRQQSNVERIYSNMSIDSRDRHLWLDGILQQRIQTLSLQYPSTSEQVDSLPLFTHLMLQATMLYLYKIAISMPWDAGEVEVFILDYKNRSSAAAQEITTSTKSLRQLTYFKVSIALCGHFIWLLANMRRYAHLLPFHSSSVPNISLQTEMVILPLIRTFRIVFGVLRDLKNVNNLARMHLTLLDLDHVSPTPSSTQGF